MSKKIGFACLDSETLNALSVQGGRASHDPAKPKAKRAHEWNSDTARLAALKSWENRRNRQCLTSTAKERNDDGTPRFPEAVAALKAAE